jgi:hypothetical protein
MDACSGDTRLFLNKHSDSRPRYESSNENLVLDWNPIPFATIEFATKACPLTSAIPHARKVS